MTDRRVSRTKVALRTALLELLAERGYEGISVQALVDRADVGRATFYAHYADKEDVLLESLEALGEHIRSQIDPDESTKVPLSLRFAFPMLRHVREAGDRFFTFQNIPVLEQKYRGVLRDLVAEQISTTKASPENAGVPKEVVAELVAAGFLAVARWWVRQAPELTPQEVYERFVALMSPVLTRDEPHG